MHRIRALIAARPGWPMTLLACALIVRALVPAGWMVMPTAAGVAIVPCSGMAPAAPAMAMPMAMPMAMAGPMHHHAPDQPAPDHPCAFAAAAVVAHVPVAVAVILPFAAAHVAFASDAAAIVPGRGLAAPPPPATGPPARA